MSQLVQYRRAKTPGASYFFTVVTYQRQLLFHTPETLDLLRSAFRSVKAKFSFTIDATVVLLDHLHCIWTLPEGDADFFSRWRRIKGEFSRQCPGYSTQVTAKGDRTGISASF